MAKVPDPLSLAYTPLAIVQMNGQQFRITKATLNNYMLGQPGQYDITLPLQDEFGNSLIDSQTLDYIFNSPYLPYDVFMGNSINGNPADLTYMGTGLCDQIAARYNVSDGQVLEIIGPDLLGLFSQTVIVPSHYLNSKSSDIVLNFCLGHNLTPEVYATANPIKQYYQQNTSFLTSASQTQLDMIQFLAKLEGFVFYVNGYQFYFGPPVDGPSFDLYYHDGVNPDTVYDLEIDRNPRGNKNILVIGETYDRTNKVAYVVGQQSANAPTPTPGSGLNFDLPVGVNPLAPIGSAASGLSFTETGSSSYITTQEGSADAALVVTVLAPPGTTAKALKSMVQAKLLSLLMNEYVCQATMPGNPSLQRNSPIIVHPGQVVPQGQRQFWVTEITHEFDLSAGFTTQFMATNFPYGYQMDDGSNTTPYVLVPNG